MLTHYKSAKIMVTTLLYKSKRDIEYLTITCIDYTYNQPMRIKIRSIIMSTLSVSCKMVLFHIRLLINISDLIEWKQNIDCKLASLSDTLEVYRSN